MFAAKLRTTFIVLVTCLFFVVHVSGTTAESMKNETKYVLSPQSRNRTENETNRNKTTTCRAFPRPEDSSKFLQFTEHSLVNIVDMHFVIENNYTTYTKSLIWVNSVGREILSVFDIGRLFITSTLNAGRRSIDIHVLKEPKGCVWINASDKYFAEINIVNYYGLKIKPEEELCFTSLIPLKIKPRWCCKFIKNGRKKRRHCYLSAGSLLGEHVINLKLITFYLFLSLLTLNVWYICVLFRQQFPYGGHYYKLSGSPLSLASIYMEITARGGSSCASHFRICCLLLFGVFCLLSFATASNKSVYILLVLYIFFLPFNFVMPALMSRCVFSRSSTRKSYGKRMLKYFLAGYYRYIFDENNIKENEFHRAVHLLTLPFNIKLWRKAIPSFYRNKLSRIARTMNNVIIKYAFYFACIFILLCYILTLIGFATIILFINLFYNAARISAIFYHLPSRMDCHALVYYPSLIYATLIMLFSISFFWILIPHAMIPLFSGLILNSVYYLPYVTLISVVSFYTWTSWKSLTGEYFALKILIYEALVQLHGQNNEINDDQHIVHVVSKKLYQNIRERLLPYHFKFLVLFLKFLLISAFALGVFMLVKMLQAVDSSRTVTVIATLTTGSLPYILNIVMERMSEEEKKTQNEIMKGNVERLVKKLTTDDPELAKTILILPEPEISSEIESETNEHLMQNVSTDTA